jgi:6,7-dimethyl-8-ribityllumazine synthase
MPIKQLGQIRIIAADFNREIIDDMIAAAQDEAQTLGLNINRVVRVPGCYEVPLAADAALGTQGVDGLVVLGFIERGETLHGEVMGHVVHRALIDLQLKYRKPMGLGIIGPGATLDQANARKTSYARAAVRALVASGRVIYENQ